MNSSNHSSAATAASSTDSKDKADSNSVTKKRGDKRGNSASRLSRMLTKVLRHSAVEEGLDIRPDGYIRLKDIFELQRFKDFDIDAVKEIVADCQKQRFALSQEQNGEWWIRANQGHSIESVKSASLLERVEPSTVPVCVHGTYMNVWDAISRQGLSRMSRNHIHFAQGLPGENGVISGMRKSADLLIFLNTAAAHQVGLELFRSENGVILTCGLDVEGETGIIPPYLFEKVIERKSGKILFQGKLPQPLTKLKPSAEKEHTATSKRRRKESEKFSRMLGKVLKHSAEKEGVEIDTSGYVNIRALPDRFSSFTLEDYKGLDEKRYSMKKEGDDWFIRANDGHSIKSVGIEK